MWFLIHSYYIHQQLSTVYSRKYTFKFMLRVCANQRELVTCQMLGLKDEPKKEGLNITDKPGGRGKVRQVYNRGRWSLKLSREGASV